MYIQGVSKKGDLYIYRVNHGLDLAQGGQYDNNEEKKVKEKKSVKKSTKK